MSKFAATIKTYNQHAAKFAQHFEEKLGAHELTKFLSRVRKGGLILDAGCGSARDAAYFMSKGYQAQGIDLSEGLLAEAKKLHPEVPTQPMSLTDITLPESTFDGVWCKAALLHLERKDIPTVLHSFYRILKPGGHLFIQTKVGEGEGSQPVPFDTNMTRHFTFFTLEEMIHLLEEAHFKILDGYDFNGKQRSEKSRDQDWLVIFAHK